MLKKSILLHTQELSFNNLMSMQASTNITNQVEFLLCEISKI